VLTPTLAHCVSLPAPRGGRDYVAPTLPTSCGSLPPEGAAAPAVWRSQSRGPCLNNLPPRSLASRNFLPPAGAVPPAARQSRFRGRCLNNLPPRSLASRSFLPPAGAAAPAVWRSQSRGPCLHGKNPRPISPCHFLSHAFPDLLPLPLGEGWGEGAPLFTTSSHANLPPAGKGARKIRRNTPDA
jgi:hypothetical protein